MTVEFDTFFQRVKERQLTQAGMTLDDIVAAEWNAPAMGSGLQSRLFAEICHIKIVYVRTCILHIFDGVMSDPCVNIYLMTALPRFVRLPRVVSKCSCRRSESGSIPPGTKRFSELADPHHFLQQLVPHESQTSAEPEP